MAAATSPPPPRGDGDYKLCHPPVETFAFSSRLFKRLYPPQLELLQVQLMVRHGERTPLVHTIVAPGIPEKWPLCKDQQSVEEPRTPQDGGPPLQIRKLINPGTRQLETLHLDRWVETTTGAHGSMHHAPDRNLAATSSSRTTPPLPPQDGPDAGVCSVGMLTDIGRKSAFDLGVRLRAHYVDKLGLLPETLDSTTPQTHPLYIRSSPFNRTIDTVLHAYQGLYPADTRGSAPLAFFRRHLPVENLWPSYGQCPRLSQLYASFKQSTGEVLRSSARLAQLDTILDPLLPLALARSGIDPRTAASPRVGMHPNSLDPTRLMDMVHTVEAHRHAWPEGLWLPKELRGCSTQQFLDKSTARHWLNPYRSSVEARSLAAGPLLRDIAERMVQRVEGLGPAAHTRMGMYGCHDSSIGSMVVSLGDAPDKWPPFTSVVAFELLGDRKRGAAARQGAAKTSIGRRKVEDLRGWEQERLGGHYVRVLYNDRSVALPHCLGEGNHRPGDPYLCTLKAFKEIVDVLTPEDLARACEADPREPCKEVWTPSRGKKKPVIDTMGKADSA